MRRQQSCSREFRKSPDCASLGGGDLVEVTISRRWGAATSSSSPGASPGGQGRGVQKQNGVCSLTDLAAVSAPRSAFFLLTAAVSTRALERRDFGRSVRSYSQLTDRDRRSVSARRSVDDTSGSRTGGRSYDFVCALSWVVCVRRWPSSPDLGRAVARGSIFFYGFMQKAERPRSVRRGGDGSPSCDTHVLGMYIYTDTRRPD